MKKLISNELYSLDEIYKLTYKAFLSFRKLSIVRKGRMLNKEVVEKVMLALGKTDDRLSVSEYTEIAIESEMTIAEIEDVLSENYDDVPTEQVPAIMFTQHYLQSRGNPTADAWDQIVKFYGKEKAEAILATVRMMMLSDAYGVAWRSLLGRLKGQPDVRSNLLYEMAVVLASFTLIPLALAHSLLANFVDTELINFE